MLLLVVVIELLTITGNFGVEIVFNNPQLTTPCVKDLRSGTDVLTGTIGPNVTEAITAGWDISVSVQILTSLGFAEICPIILEPAVIFCRPTVDLCNCDYVDANGTAHIRIKSAALQDHSEGIIRGEWRNSNGNYYHSDNLTLPHIYDVTNATLKLKVNNETTDLPSDSCGSNFIPNEDNTVELCCSNTASPCYPRMSFSDDVVIENQTMCVRRTFNAHNKSSTVSVTASYSVCTLNDYITRGSCLIETRTETPIVCDIALCVGLPVGIGVPTIIFTGGVIVYILKRKKRTAKQKVSTKQEESPIPEESTNDNLQGEQAARNTRNQVYGNNAFDGDTTNPSNYQNVNKGNLKENKNSSHHKDQHHRSKDSEHEHSEKNTINENTEQTNNTTRLNENTTGIKPGARRLPPLKSANHGQPVNASSKRPTSVEETLAASSKY